MAKVTARPKRSNNTKNRQQAAERKARGKEIAALALHEDLKAYEQFKEQLLPQLRAALLRGDSAEEIYSTFTNLAAARAISIAALEPDSGKALSAIKEVLDRVHGKAVERKQVSHHLDQLPDEELDALLLSASSQEED